MIATLIKAVPVVCATDARLILLEHYESAFRIYDHHHEDPERPLALIEMHPAEDTTTCSLLYERMEQFAVNEVAKRFNISFNQFLEFPKDMVDEMMAISARMRNKEDTDTANVLRNLQGGKNP